MIHTLTEIVQGEKNIILKLEDATSPSGKLVNGNLEFHNVSQLFINDEPTSTMTMIYPDGGIKDLEQNANLIEIFISWIDYKTHNSQDYD